MGFVCVCVGGGGYDKEMMMKCPAQGHDTMRTSDPSFKSTTDCLTSLEI